MAIASRVRRGATTAFGLLFLLVRRLIRDIEDTLGTVDALAVLKQANEHLRSTVEDGLNVGRGYGGLIRYELDELLELDIRMQVNSGVPEGFSGLVEADFTLNSFDLDHDRLIYC